MPFSGCLQSLRFGVTARDALVFVGNATLLVLVASQPRHGSFPRGRRPGRPQYRAPPASVFTPRVRWPRSPATRFRQKHRIFGLHGFSGSRVMDAIFRAFHCTI